MFDKCNFLCVSVAQNSSISWKTGLLYTFRCKNWKKCLFQIVAHIFSRRVHKWNYRFFLLIKNSRASPFPMDLYIYNLCAPYLRNFYFSDTKSHPEVLKVHVSLLFKFNIAISLLTHMIQCQSKIKFIIT